MYVESWIIKIQYPRVTDGKARPQSFVCPFGLLEEILVSLSHAKSPVLMVRSGYFYTSNFKFLLKNNF
jgi:hypothetical protein